MIKLDFKSMESAFAEIYDEIGFEVNYYPVLDNGVNGIYGNNIDFTWGSPYTFNAVIHKEDEKNPNYVQPKTSDIKYTNTIHIKFVKSALKGIYPKLNDKVETIIYGKKQTFIVHNIDKNIELIDLYFRVTLVDINEMRRP